MCCRDGGVYVCVGTCVKVPATKFFSQITTGKLHATDIRILVAVVILLKEVFKKHKQQKQTKFVFACNMSCKLVNSCEP